MPKVEGRFLRKRSSKATPLPFRRIRRVPGIRLPAGRGARATWTRLISTRCVFGRTRRCMRRGPVTTRFGLIQMAVALFQAKQWFRMVRCRCRSPRRVPGIRLPVGRGARATWTRLISMRCASGTTRRCMRRGRSPRFLRIR